MVCADMCASMQNLRDKCSDIYYARNISYMYPFLNFPNYFTRQLSPISPSTGTREFCLFGRGRVTYHLMFHFFFFL